MKGETNAMNAIAVTRQNKIADLLKMLICLVTLGVFSVASASEPDQIDSYDVNVSHGLTFSSNKSDPPAPLALRGYDTVSYFTDGKPQLGTSQHAVLHNGAIYWFSSEKHKQKFESDPDHYLPQYGGFCAYGVTQATKFDGDPLLWNIHKGKLYLNVTPALRKKWLGEGLVNLVGNSLDQNIAKADRIWKRISNAKPEALFKAWAAKQ
ncbi:MAG: YHS domain-containing protein [Gammaproteobacteria bacterium]|nr:MAG: YHS domain-containing protein [Gammaproteobacteria bacterium]